MNLGKMQRILVIADRRMRIAQTPASSRLAHLVAQLLGNGQMSLVVVDGRDKVAQQRVGVAEAIARLCLDGPFAEVNGQR